MKQNAIKCLVLSFVVGTFCLLSVPAVSHAQTRNVVEVAARAGSFNTLIAAVKAAGLEETLRNKGPFTIFAPTDDAFAALPEGTIQELLKPENKQKLISILTYHVLSGKIKSTDLLNQNSAKTVNGQNVPIGLRIQNANVTAVDIEASNGVIHVIDAVLLPPSNESRTALPSHGASHRTRNTSPNSEDNGRAQLEEAQEKWNSSHTEQYNHWQQTQAAPRYRRALTRIESAIRRGSTMYDNGNAAACASLYMRTAETLMSQEPLPNDVRTALSDALVAAREIHHEGDRAWKMRHALDKVYQDLKNG